VFPSSSRLLARLGRWPRRVAALTCLALAVLSAIAGHSAHRSSTGTLGPSASVVVAAHDLGAAHTLTRGDLATAAWPRALLPAGTAARPGGLVGRRLAGPISAGEPVSARRLVGAGLTAGQPRGTVAAAVRTDAGVAELIHPGDYVDVLAGPADETLPGAPSVGAGGAALLAQGVAVLAVLPPATSAASGDGEAKVLIATDRGTALRIVALQAHQVLAVVGDRP
jgi:Flp pilus assembly protein CpaB